MTIHWRTGSDCVTAGLMITRLDLSCPIPVTHKKSAWNVFLWCLTDILPKLLPKWKMETMLS